MKQILWIIIALCHSCFIWSQEGLQVALLFDGPYKKKHNAIEVLVKGEQLSSYHLTLFRSLTIKNDPEAFKEIERCVKVDAKEAIDKEEGMLGQELYYGFYCFPPEKKQNRYLFYRNTYLKERGKSEVTTVYMEGYATMEELKKMFKKNR
jgi:hypothetical protein